MIRFLTIDASFAFRLIVPGSYQARCRALASQWENDGYALCAPTLWLYEMTSALCKVVSFGKLTATEGRRSLALVQDLDVELIPPNSAQARLAFDWTMRLNRAASYDSFYLALAESLGCEFWTADKRLHRAVSLPWVRLISDK